MNPPGSGTHVMSTDHTWLPVPGCQPADRPQEVGDGPAAGGQDGGGQGDQPGVGRVGEVRDERGQQ
jgi:hypothetical protein